MKEQNKIFIRKISNKDNYNELDIDKSEKFLDSLQDFIVDIGLAKVKKGEYEHNGKSYDITTWYALFYEDHNKNFDIKKTKINEFNEGRTIRYFNKDTELLIIFLKTKIKLIFYSDEKNRRKIINSLMKFCQVMKVD